MDPVTWIEIGVAVVGAMSAMDSASANADAARGQANIAATQATVARETSDNALAVGNANEEQQRRQSALLLGQKRAGLLAAGIGTDGSASDVYGQDVGIEALKALNARYDGQLKSWSALNQAGMDDMQSSLDLNKASAAETAGSYGAASSLLGGASKVFAPKAGGGGGGGGGSTSFILPGSVTDSSVSSTILPSGTAYS